MGWYICLAAALILMVLAAKAGISRRYGPARIGLVLVELASATFIIYIPIFFSLYAPATAVFSDIINVFQVVSLDADYGAFYDMINEGTGIRSVGQVYMVVLGVLHFLMPVVSFLAVYSLLVLCYSSLQMFFVNLHRCPLYVFSVQNEHALDLARDIQRNIRRCDIVFTDCSDSERRKDDSIRQRFVFHPSPLQKIGFENRNRKDIYYFCISDDEDSNLNTALYLIDRLSAQPKPVQQNSHVFIFSQQDGTDMMIDSTDKGSIDIRIVNRSENAAYKLIADYPLYRYAKHKKMSVLLCGFGKVNREVLKAAVWCGILEGYQMEIAVAGIRMEEEIDAFYDCCPDLRDEAFHIRFISCATRRMLEQQLKAHCSHANYVVVDFGGDEVSIDVAVRLRRLFYGVGGTFDNRPPIFLYVEDREKYGMVAGLRTSETVQERRIGYDLIPFGEASTLDTYQELVASRLDLLSKNVHLEYEDIFSEGGIDVAAALERYDALEVNKRSNRANAMHIRYKLALLGLDYTEDADAEEVDFGQYLTAGRLELLTRAEHVRWMRFLQTEGWSTASVDEVNAYKRSGISAGRHNCQILKKHPYICDFDELQERSEALGLPDSTVYDRELIVRIPNILHDRWNVSGKTYKIIKMKDREE